ncbi:MAG TPA: hypothetical protein VNG12_07480, partial [Acidimicrobiales bacterium]|nr:hypothetical protein [Acidimicrobiales bacterium]
MADSGVGTPPQDLVDLDGLLWLKAERDAVLRVASGAAAGSDLSGLCCLVAKEACGRLGADTGAVARFGEGTPATVGYWSASSDGDDGSLARVVSDVAARVATTGRPVLVDGAVGVPIIGPDRVWGAILVADERCHVGNDYPATSLAGFARLVGMLVVGASDRALVESGAPDCLTGLARRSTFDESFVREV